MVFPRSLMKIGQLLKVICAALMKIQTPLADQLQAVIVTGLGGPWLRIN